APGPAGTSATAASPAAAGAGVPVAPGEPTPSAPGGAVRAESAAGPDTVAAVGDSARNGSPMRAPAPTPVPAAVDRALTPAALVLPGTPGPSSATTGAPSAPSGPSATPSGAPPAGASAPAASTATPAASTSAPTPAPATTDPIVFAAPAVGATFPVAATAASSSATPSPVATPPAPLTSQLSRPLFTLAAAGPGVHVVTVDVAPEALGPVTVRAHVSAHGTHVEMFAASDAGRDAVRAILGDLRRDLATAASTTAGGAGHQTSVDLSSQDQPSDGRGDRSGQLGSPGAQSGADGGAGRQAR
ncbi:flagellar hook-length control protein FliK, partial [Frigoribacterium sp. CFBP 13605]